MIFQGMQTDVNDWLRRLSELAVECEKLTVLEPAHKAQMLWMGHTDLKNKVANFKVKLAEVLTIHRKHFPRVMFAS